MQDKLQPDQLKENARTIPLFQRFITVEKSGYQLAVWDREPGATMLNLLRTFPCAIGSPYHATRTGPALIMRKSTRPDWQVPDSQWAIDAGLTPGRIVPWDDPSNPIRGAFLAFTDDGQGIHGTDNIGSLGHPASHGCVRVRVTVAEWLYTHIPVGTPVMVHR